MNKICSHCEKSLPVENFGKNKHTKDKLTYWCKSCIKQNSDEQYNKNKEARLAQQKSRQEQYKEQKAAYDRQYRQENKSILSAQGRQYYQEHKKEIEARNKSRREQDPLFKLASYLRGRLRNVLHQKSLTKTATLSQYLGCTLEELKIHLEKQFQPGMTWDNHTRDGWHIDHILPLQPEVPISQEEVHTRYHYTNLRPLWAIDNIKKSNKLL